MGAVDSLLKSNMIYFIAIGIVGYWFAFHKREQKRTTDWIVMRVFLFTALSISIFELLELFELKIFCKYILTLFFTAFSGVCWDKQLRNFIFNTLFKLKISEEDGLLSCFDTITSNIQTNKHHNTRVILYLKDGSIILSYRFDYIYNLYSDNNLKTRPVNTLYTIDSDNNIAIYVEAIIDKNGKKIIQNDLELYEDEGIVISIYSFSDIRCIKLTHISIKEYGEINKI